MRPERALLDLARLHGVQTRYRGVDRRVHTASPDTLVELLRSLDVDLDRVDDAPKMLQDVRTERAERVLPGCVVAWTDRPEEDAVRIRVPEDAGGSVGVAVELEDGDVLEGSFELGRSPGRRADDTDAPVVDRDVPLPGGVPAGVHRIHVRHQRVRASTVLVAAPRRCPRPPRSPDWGIFAPTYALGDPGRAAAGCLTDLGELARRAGEHGAELVATLPLLATFLDGPLDPSPYAPVSRLAWNECYLDLTALPGVPHEPSSDGHVSIDPPDGGLVDWEAAWARTDEALETAADALDGRARTDVAAFAREHPLMADYAVFRAQRERHGTDWRRWPADARRDGSLDRRRELRHLFGQYAMHRQLSGLRDGLAHRGQTLVLDLPLGSHPRGFDLFRFPESFADGVSAGAPPDDFFAEGQIWGFPPLHPARSSRDGHRLLRECLRAHLRFAGLLRFDHVMALHRLYWVPEGASGREGAYVRYPSEELYAVVSLEASRAGAEIVGEDLGTVPDTVRRGMARHGLARLYTAQAELDAAREPLDPPRRSVACVNTHDMPPFAAWWAARDPARRAIVGELLDRAGGRVDTRDPTQVLGAILVVLGRSRARHVLVALEDLWLEARPQNVPGTGSERANWRGRIGCDLDALTDDPGVAGLLGELDRSRKEDVRR